MKHARKPPRIRQDALPHIILGKMLRDALIASWVKLNPFHTSPQWEEIKALGRDVPYVAVAQELLARGVTVPLPPAPPPRRRK